ncbi:MAG: hypothetical protein INF98_03120 [Roseomonas sp.]|nr:hypothetical protein [Roseomonas sp.]
MEQHGTTPEAKFVYKAWLDAKGEVAPLREKLLAWVAQHGTTPDARFVYQAWLDSGHPFKEIQQACEEWLKHNWQREDAVYLIKNLSGIPDLPLPSLARILSWVGLFPTNEDAIYRLSRASRFFGRHLDKPGFLRLVVKSSQAAIAALVARAQVTPGQKDAVIILMGNLATKEFARNPYWRDTLQLFRLCLRHRLLGVNGFSVSWASFILFLHDALKEGVLDPALDAEAIRRAHDLVAQTAPPEHYCRLLETGYLPPPPSLTPGAG